MEPYYFTNATVAFKKKSKKRKRDHPSQISRVGPSNIREFIQKRKKKNAKFKSYNKRCYVPSKRRVSAPKKLTTIKWIEYQPYFQYLDELFRCFPENLRLNMREEQRSYQE